MTSRRKSPERKGGGAGKRADTAAPPKAAPPEAAAPGHSTPGISTEDAALWRRVAGATKPLPGRRVARARPPDPPAGPKPTVPDEPMATAKAPGARAGTSPTGQPTALPPLAPGAAPGIDQRTAMRLQRGQLPVDARVDLHGLTREEGFQRFSLFVQEAWESGARCVLVITGKGSRSRGEAAPPSLRDGAIGVLREALPGWINRAALRPLVLAFCPARPKHGGVGAFYLLLKRRR